MIILSFLFFILLFVVLIYFGISLPLRWLKYSGMAISIPLLLLYLFVRNVDLASTPVTAISTNRTNEQLQLYYVSYFSIHEPIVLANSCLEPGETASNQFESEGFRKIWAIAVNEQGQVIFSEERRTINIISYETSFAVTSQTNISENVQKEALDIINKFRWLRIIENGLLFGSITLVILLIIKRKQKPVAKAQ